MPLLKIGVLGSTRGTDLQAVIDAIEKKELGAKIVLVASNKSNAFVLERAKSHKIKTVFLDPKKFSSKTDFDAALAELFEKEKTDLILLIGYMRVLSVEFCKKFENRLINIHPSLLPMFAGQMDLNVHVEVKKMGLRETGCTLHFVTADVDEGPIIMQKRVAVYPNDSVEDIKNKVQMAEQQVILKALKLFAEQKIVIKNGLVKILD